MATSTTGRSCKIYVSALFMLSSSCMWSGGKLLDCIKQWVLKPFLECIYIACKVLNLYAHSIQGASHSVQHCMTILKATSFFHSPYQAYTQNIAAQSSHQCSYIYRSGKRHSFQNMVHGSGCQTKHSHRHARAYRNNMNPHNKHTHNKRQAHT